MATRKQIRANRRNARRSTGPRTETGKAASSANALGHGLTARYNVVLHDEDAGAFARLREGVIADLAPAGALQEVLAERVAVLLWRLDRAARMEAELFIHGEFALDRASLDSAGWRSAAARLMAEQVGPEAVEVHEERQKRKIHLESCMYAEAPCARVLVERRERARAFDQIARHEATLQRALHRTLDEFRRLRAAAGTAAAATEPDAPQPEKSADRHAEPAVGAARDPAPASDACPAKPQGSRKPASESRAGAEGDAERQILQNEANSAQPLERGPDAGAGVNPPTAPPTA